MKHIISILSITLLFSLCVTAQNNATKKADKHFNKFEFMSALVKINDSIVAKLGAIIPEPFAIPHIFTSSSPARISS